MAKVIYTIKMQSLCAQFKKTAAEERSIPDIAILTVVVYLRAWRTAPTSLSWGKLLICPHTTISAATSKKLGLHLYFL